MKKQIEKKILLFTEGTGVTDRAEMVHGSLYVKFKEADTFDWFHAELRKAFRTFIDPKGGVNMYSLPGDEFVYDFVPEESETPVFADEEKGVWSEFAEEGLMKDEPQGSRIDTMLELENEMSRGK